MNTAALLAYASALFCGVVALIVGWHERRSPMYLVFVAGMALLAAECVFDGMAWASSSPPEILRWQQWKMLASSLLPGVWLLFSLSYGRGNYREFLSRGKLTLLIAFLVPTTLVFFGDQELFTNGRLLNGSWQLSLGVTGFYFYLLLLAALVLIGINLEKTYRAAVGVMRWRIKFMVLGLGVLFAVRFCTSRSEE